MSFNNNGGGALPPWYTMVFDDDEAIAIGDHNGSNHHVEDLNESFEESTISIDSDVNFDSSFSSECSEGEDFDLDVEIALADLYNDFSTLPVNPLYEDYIIDDEENGEGSHEEISLDFSSDYDSFNTDYNNFFDHKEEEKSAPK